MQRSATLCLPAALLLALSAACGLERPVLEALEVHDESDHEEPLDIVAGWGRKSQSLAVSGRWQLPPDVAAAGDAQNVTFNNAPPYDGGSNCAPGPTAGALTMRDALLGFFPQAYQIGIYNCRVIAGTNSMSLHGVGRALDIMIATVNGQADNGAGDPIANWLVENAEALGVQTVIWDSTIWRVSNSPRARAYSGSNPHIDHLHVEINIDAANQNPAWYDAPWGPVACDPLAPEVAVLDEGHSCFSLFGPAQYWRHETGAGVGGSLYWTNAFENDTPSNWARWSLPLVEAGDYEIEVNVAGAYGVFDAARYTVRAGGTSHPVVVDQSAVDGWTSLGVFSFHADGGESVILEDNAPGPVGAGQQIVADALRLTPVAVGCQPLPAAGGVIDENGPCFDLFGPSSGWRSVTGAGHGGSLLWTNAFENDAPSNWAEWEVSVTVDGEYSLEVYVDPTHGQFTQVHYEVDTGSAVVPVVLDQAAASGWAPLGTFALEANAAARVTVLDNHSGPVGTERRLAVDALRAVALAPVTAPPDQEPSSGNPPTGDTSEGPQDQQPPASSGKPPLTDDPSAVVDADEPMHDDDTNLEPLSLPPSVDDGGCSGTRSGGHAAFAWLGLLLLLRRRGRTAPRV